MKSYILPANEKTKIPKSVIYFDTEAHINSDLVHNHYLTVAWINNEYKIYIDKNLHQFWNDLELLKTTKTYIFAHNIKYDMMVSNSFIHLKKLGWIIKAFSFDNPQFFVFQKKKKKLIFLSSTNFFHTSLQKLGKIIGLEKQEIDYTGDNQEKEIEYCINDVEILKRTMEHYFEFLITNDLGNFQMTIAGQAFTAFRHKFMNKKIYLHHSKNADLERNAYYGGRTEAFMIGKISGNIYCLDINSMYPYVMKTKKFPVKFLSSVQDLEIDRAKDYIKRGYCIIADCEMNTQSNRYPKVVNHRLVFPVGNFQTYLAGDEFEHALNNNDIEKIYTANIYQQDFLFAEYIDFFYNKRLLAKKNKNEVENMMYKLFLNSLYGKFGQKNIDTIKIGESEKDYFREEVYNFDKKEYSVEYTIANEIFKILVNGNAKYSFVAIAACITAASRNYLSNLLDIAKKENVYYCDTDSVFVNQNGHDILEKENCINNKELGKLKIEYIETEMEIRGLKDYYCKTQGLDKIKGISKKSKQISDNEFEVLKWDGIPTYLNKQIYQNTIFTKKLSRNYTKGYVIENNIYPFEFKNGYIVEKETDNDLNSFYKYTKDYSDKENEKISDKYEREQKKTFIKQVLSYGGINDESYNEYIPNFLKRKTGVKLEDLSDSLLFMNENDVMSFIQKHWPV